MENRNLGDSQQPRNPDERSPLLRTQDGNGSLSRDKCVRRMLRGPVSSLLLLAVFCIMIEAGSVLESLPLYKVFEGIICDQFEECSHVPISCDEDERVQGKLALLRGYRGTVSLIPGLVMSIPYGVMAETYGHRVVMSLSALGIFIEAALTVSLCWWPQAFQFPIVCLLPLCTFVGGGPSVLSAMVFTSLSELSTDASRATLFAYFEGIDLGVRLALSILAANMMDRNAWVPIWIGLGCSAASVIWSVCLPKTPRDTSSGDAGRCAQDVPVDASTESQRVIDGQDTLQVKIRGGVRRNIDSLIFLFKQTTWTVLILMLCLLLTSIGWSSVQALPQLARKRFGWSWSSVSYLVPLETGVCIAVLVALLPIASFVMSKRLSMSALSRDVVIIRSSCFLVALGAVIVGASGSSPVMIAGLCVFYLGTGYNVILRSLLATVVEGNTPILFNCVALLETLGSLLSGPLMAVSFKVGLGLGGTWVGLPFFIGAGLSAAAFLALSAARFPAVNKN